MSRNEIETRKFVLDVWLKNKHFKLKKLVKTCKVSLPTAANVLKLWNQGLTVERKPKTRQSRIPDKKIDQKVKLQLKRNPELSVRDIGWKTSVPKSTVQEIKIGHGYKSYKKQKFPGRTASQFETGKTRGRRLIRNKLQGKKCCIIMDDESYCKLDCKTIPGPQFYTILKGLKAPASIKAIKTEKFGKKVLIWQAICQCGEKSEPYIQTGTMNSDIYIKECLQKRLLPLVRKHNSSVLFWPDLATIHYSRATTEWYNRNDIDYVPKDMNPANVPQIRPIEKYWAIMKQKLRKEGRTTESITEFRRLYNKTSKKFTKTDVQELMKGVRIKLRKYVDQSDDEIF